MGKGHIAVNKYMSDKARFADLVNGKLFGGEQVVLPEELEKVDGESEILLEDKNQKTIGKTRYRDLVMRWKRGADFCFIGCENQSEIHHAMPVRNMLYDSLSYTNQIAELWKSHNKGKGEGLEPAEYLSHFRKGDKIYPVVTIVFYYGSEPWTGNCDLYSMFQLSDMTKEKLARCVPNYWINLVDAGHMEDISCFQTDLQKIMGMLKCKNKGDDLQKYMEKNKAFFEHLDYNTSQAIGEFLQSEQLRKMTKRDNGKGERNMCKAIEEIYQNGIKTGEARGEARGEVRGEVRGEQKGLVEVYQEDGKSREETIERFAVKFQVNREEAEEKVNEFWKD